MSSARRTLASALAGALLVALALTGSSAEASGSWNLAPRVPAGAGWVMAARAGSLALSLRNTAGTVVASVDPGGGSQGSLSELAAGLALIAWIAPLDSGGQELVGVARTDVVAVTVVLDDGNTATLPVDSLDGFAYTAGDARVLEVQAIDAMGATVGEIAVPPTGPSCGQSICRALAGATSQAGAGGPLYGIFSIPRRPMAGKRVRPFSPILFYGGPTSLSRVDPRTLARTGKHLVLPANFEPQAFSPDGTRLLGLAYPQNLTVIDLKTMTVDPALRVRLRADLGTEMVRASAWLTRDRLLVLAQRLGGAYDRDVVSRTLLAIDPRTGAVVWKRTLSKKLAVLSAQPVGHRLVLLLAPSGPRRFETTVLVANTNGKLRSFRITTPHTKQNFNPGTLVVTSGSHPAAFIVASHTIYSIDLDNARLTPHRVAAPTSAPRATPTIWGRYQAGSLDGKLVVGGGVFPLPTGIARTGIYLIDPTTWKVRLISRTDTDFVTSDQRLVTFGRAIPEVIVAHKVVNGHGNGITIYDQNGTQLHHLYGERRFLSVTVTPTLDYAIAVLQPKRSRPQPLPALVQQGQREVFDPTTGKSVGHTTAILGSPRLIYPGQSFSNG